MFFLSFVFIVVITIIDAQLFFNYSFNYSTVSISGVDCGYVVDDINTSLVPLRDERTEDNGLLYMSLDDCNSYYPDLSEPSTEYAWRYSCDKDGWLFFFEYEGQSAKKVCKNGLKFDKKTNISDLVSDYYCGEHCTWEYDLINFDSACTERTSRYEFRVALEPCIPTGPSSSVQYTCGRNPDNGLIPKEVNFTSCNALNTSRCSSTVVLWEFNNTNCQGNDPSVKLRYSQLKAGEPDCELQNPNLDIDCGASQLWKSDSSLRDTFNMLILIIVLVVLGVILLPIAIYLIWRYCCKNKNNSNKNKQEMENYVNNSNNQSEMAGI